MNQKKSLPLSNLRANQNFVLRGAEGMDFTQCFKLGLVPEKEFKVVMKVGNGAYIISDGVLKLGISKEYAKQIMVEAL